MADRIFTLKDWKRMKRDIFDDFFAQHDLDYDYKELMKAQLLGSPGEVPEGSHGMPDNSLMLDSEMPQIEGGY